MLAWQMMLFAVLPPRTCFIRKIALLAPSNLLVGSLDEPLLSVASAGCRLIRIEWITGWSPTADDVGSSDRHQPSLSFRALACGLVGLPNAVLKGLISDHSCLSA